MGADLRFTITARDGDARCGQLELAHGVVSTPAFMPVGTRAAIKALTLDQVEQLDPEIILANTITSTFVPETSASNGWVASTSSSGGAGRS